MRHTDDCYSKTVFSPECTEVEKTERTQKTLILRYISRLCEVWYKLMGFYNKGVKITGSSE